MHVESKNSGTVHVDSPILDRDFFFRPPSVVARHLLGSVLSTTQNGATTSGIIVETEAYAHVDDPASHAHRGLTPRNQAMFLEGGHCYVYLIYGLHFCVNVVTEAAGIGSAVLIRALQPLDGVETMKQRRAIQEVLKLTSGPAKICKALKIDRSLSGEDLLSSASISIKPHTSFSDKEVLASPRIGITRALEKEWRYFVGHNPYVSRRK